MEKFIRTISIQTQITIVMLKAAANKFGMLEIKLLKEDLIVLEQNQATTV
ncbi:hypothetical protein ACFFIX_13185 [Metabacillus herbersteinensis]|uniref:Uncharacterized protein n=1 Tax=Metabacillus herbersteinensis TaxID=283816 RepID=A0ABV6GFC9_9BACI